MDEKFCIIGFAIAVPGLFGAIVGLLTNLRYGAERRPRRCCRWWRAHVFLSDERIMGAEHRA